MKLDGEDQLREKQELEDIDDERLYNDIERRLWT
jgi:hypothetical protein